MEQQRSTKPKGKVLFPGRQGRPQRSGGPPGQKRIAKRGGAGKSGRFLLTSVSAFFIIIKAIFESGVLWGVGALFL